MEKITYTSLSSLGEDFHQAFDLAVAKVRTELGQAHPLFINGRPKKSRRAVFADRSPADRRVLLGKFKLGTREINIPAGEIQDQPAAMGR